MSDDEHYSIEDWADWSRGAAEGVLEAAMRTHLETGCRHCREIHTSFARLHRFARRDAGYEPPASTIRRAAAAFDIPKPRSVFVHLAEAAQLLFDSQTIALPIGVRGAAGPRRRLVFKNGDLLIDIQVSASGASQGRVLVGQIGSQIHSHDMEGTHVLLHTARRRIAKAAVNDLGEFQMEFQHPADDMTLTCIMQNGVTVIPLGTLS
jgi:hypothetical protein